MHVHSDECATIAHVNSADEKGAVYSGAPVMPLYTIMWVVTTLVSVQFE